MKIICTCLNSKYIHSSLSPWCIKAGIEKFCSDDIKATVYDSTINGDIEAFAQLLINEKPDVIGVSCYIWNIVKSLELCKLIKDKYDCIIVLGGPEVAYCADAVLNRYSYIDYVLSGEGEWSFPSLINALNNSSALSDAENLFYKDSFGQIISTPAVFHNDTPPSPYCDEYIGALNGRIAYIESSRGCPYRCAYCLSGRVGNLKLFNLDQVKADLIKLANSGTKTIKFIDRTFNASAEHANAILNFIKENFSDKNVCFHFEISADTLKESTSAILSEMPAGLIQLEAGIQSFNTNTLEAINRKCNFQKLKTNISQLISDKNIHIHTDLIAGLPYENYESFINGFNIAFNMKPDMLQLGFLKLLHGSDLENNLYTNTAVFSEVPPYEVISTDWISKEELNEIKFCEAALDKLYNSSRFLLTIDYILEYTKISPFELFRQFGKAYNLSKIPLKQLVLYLFQFFSTMCDTSVLREKICCDLIASGANINFPDELIAYNPNYKKYMKYFSEKLKTNVKIVILESQNCIFAVTSQDKRDLNGRFLGTYYDIDEIVIK